jgi:CheY-like chemotaxis protein
VGDSKKHILIVEDSPDVQELLRKLLTGVGYEVRCCFNGRDALSSLRSTSHLPNVILLDLMMPDMDGYEFRQEQEKDSRIAEVPIVVMTAGGEVQFKAIKVGAKGHLRKPFESIDLILSTVERFFR